MWSYVNSEQLADGCENCGIPENQQVEWRWRSPQRASWLFHRPLVQEDRPEAWNGRRRGPGMNLVSPTLRHQRGGRTCLRRALNHSVDSDVPVSSSESVLIESRARFRRKASLSTCG